MTYICLIDLCMYVCMLSVLGCHRHTYRHVCSMSAYHKTLSFSLSSILLSPYSSISHHISLLFLFSSYSYLSLSLSPTLTLSLVFLPFELSLPLSFTPSLSHSHSLSHTHTHSLSLSVALCLNLSVDLWQTSCCF